jgi:hypothetical protein
VRRIGYYDAELGLLWARARSAVGDPPKRPLRTNSRRVALIRTRETSSMRPTPPEERQRCGPEGRSSSSLGEKIRCYQRAPEAHSNDGVDTAWEGGAGTTKGAADRRPAAPSSFVIGKTYKDNAYTYTGRQAGQTTVVAGRSRDAN